MLKEKKQQAWWVLRLNWFLFDNLLQQSWDKCVVFVLLNEILFVKIVNR